MLAEALPLLVPQFDALIVSLLIIAAAWVSLGLVSAIDAFVRATVGGIAGLLGHIPGIGGVLSSPVNRVVHWMEHEFAAAEAALDGLLSQYIHQLGELVRWMGREIQEQAHMLYVLSTAMLGTEALRGIDTAITYVGQSLHRVDRVVSQAIGRVESIEREFEHAVSSRIGAAVHTLQKSVYGEIAGLERLTLPRLEAYGRAIADTIPQSIAGLRTWAHGLEEQYSALWHRVSRLEARVGTEVFVGAVAIALAALGASWVRCNNWRRIGRGVCGLPDTLIEGLFFGALEAFLVTDLCRFSRLIEAAAIELEPVLDELVNVQGIICLAGGASYPTGIVAGDLRGGKGHASGIVPADLAA